MSKQMVMSFRLLPAGETAYVEAHRQVWPELEAAYRAAGIQRVACYKHGLDVVVVSDVDESIHSAARAELDHNEVEQRWQQKMAPLRDPSVPIRHFEQVYRMPETNKSSTS